MNEELKQKTLLIIKNNNIHFVEDIVAKLGIHRTTFYKNDLHNDEEIKEAIEQNKINIKSEMRNRWYESDKPILQLALYKLLGNDDEVHRLSGTRQEITNKEEIKSMTKEELLNKIGQIKQLMGENKKYKPKKKKGE